MAEEAEEEVAPTAIAIAVTLLGAITFMMSLMYCINNPDKDMRRYTYEVISTTISVFIAVMIFQTCNTVVETFIMHGRSAEFKLFVGMMHMLWWFSILQVAIAVSSGALSGDEPVEDEDKNKKLEWEKTEDEVRAQYDAEVKQQEIETNKELNAMFFAILLAHITGFATIHAWGTVQQLPWLREYWWQPVGVVILSTMAQIGLRNVCDRLRGAIAGGDGKIDESEKLWDEQADDAEIDIIGLLVSFNSAQAVRYFISGVFPDVEGAEDAEDLSNHTLSQKIGLLSTGVLSLIALLVISWRKGVRSENNRKEQKARKKERDEKRKESGEENQEGDEEEEEEEDSIVRMLMVMQTACAMYNAWACFFAARWLIAGLHFSSDSMDLAVVVTILVSTSSFAAIKGLDIIADNARARVKSAKERIAAEISEGVEEDDELEEEENKAEELAGEVKAVISSLSLLIGFAWEQLFDQAVDSLSEGLEERYPGVDLTCKVILTVFVVGLVAPAWRLYILPVIVASGWRAGFVATSGNLENLAKAMKAEEFAHLQMHFTHTKSFKDSDGKRPGPEAREFTSSKCLFYDVAKGGICNNIFVDDAIYCRKCGHKRPTKGMKSEDNSRSQSMLCNDSIVDETMIQSQRLALERMDLEVRHRQLEARNAKLEAELKQVTSDLALARAQGISAFSAEMDGLLDTMSRLEATRHGTIGFAPESQRYFQQVGFPQMQGDPLRAPLLGSSSGNLSPVGSAVNMGRATLANAMG